MNYYADKRVLITGGASGIGRLLALKIAAAGARTAICDIDAAGMEKVRSEAAAKGLSLLCFPVDLSRREQIDTLAERGAQTTWRRGYPGQQRRHCFRQTVSGMQRQRDRTFTGRQSGRPYLDDPGLSARDDRTRRRSPGDHCLGRGYRRRFPVWPTIRPPSSPASGWTNPCAANSANAGCASTPPWSAPILSTPACSPG